MPYASPAGSGNFNSIAARIYPAAGYFRQFAGGLENPTVTDGYFALQGRRQDTDEWEQITAYDFPAGQDYFGALIDDTIIYNAFGFIIQTDNLPGDTPPEPRVTLRYTIFQGIRPNPF
jgi:hypothetical protein